MGPKVSSKLQKSNEHAPPVRKAGVTNICWLAKIPSQVATSAG